MSYPTYMQIKDKNSANLIELKGWRWDFGQVKEIKVHKLKALPNASVSNDPIGIDWGATRRDITLQGVLKTQKQFNRLKNYVRDEWWANQPLTLTIGTGATGFNVSGLVSMIHADYDMNERHWRVMLKFVIATVFTI